MLGSRQLHDDSPLQLAGLHLLKNIRQLVQLLRPHMRLENAPGREVQGLNGIRSSSDSRTRNRVVLQDESSGVCSCDRLQFILGNTHADNGTVEAEELHGLGVGGVGRGADDHGVRA